MQILNPWPANAVWVGRGTPLGDPFVIGRDGSREEVIARYREWLEVRIRHRDPAVLTRCATSPAVQGGEARAPGQLAAPASTS